MKHDRTRLTLSCTLTTAAQSPSMTGGDSSSAESKSHSWPAFSNTSNGPNCSSGDNDEIIRAKNTKDPPNIPEASGGSYYAQSYTTRKATVKQVVTINIEGHPVKVLFDLGSDFSIIKTGNCSEIVLKKKG
ncbi:hypothetical protein PoB_004171300 [Plakobranchus ocellatus]|uniref:Peptidase A2 domain-containing protein n=1 Tax=Plakobranchus ocellatus TaxID=259542 RepID=A0AAV4B8P5_9GAST|nr:hypothetical protein PoB_004171300 [Plakobranchus ocellatus]